MLNLRRNLSGSTNTQINISGGPAWLDTDMYDIAAKNGLKIIANPTDVEPGINTSKRAGRGLVKGTREPISILATNLGNQLGRVVIDQTGLIGAYDWVVEWDPDPNETGRP
jgi:uncharacterized protein (TIGR03435 family)